MELTREKCERALNDFHDTCCYLERRLNNECANLDKYLDIRKILDQLIKEHFDNPPLKKDEIFKLIKENNNHGATIFDARHNNEIFVTFDLYHDLCVFYFGDEWSWPFEYEENRYYRSNVIKEFITPMDEDDKKQTKFILGLERGNQFEES